jgi:hypothetical protein
MFSAELLSAVREKLPLVDFSDRARLVKYLTFVYHLIVASENILETTGFHAQMESETDLLAAYIERHLEEERDHVAWLEADLRPEGANLSALDATAVACAGSVYYLVAHVTPFALLGYLAVLECSPPAIGTINALEDVHGLRLLRTIRYHAIHDKDHGADVMDMLDDAPEIWRPIIASTALRTAEFIAQACATF